MSRTVLVVEDQEDNRRIVRDLLSSKGFEIVEATDGLAGVEAAERHRPDLILMDIQLPGIDGYEATRRIKAAPDLARIPVNRAHGLQRLRYLKKEIVARMPLGAKRALKTLVAR